MALEEGSRASLLSTKVVLWQESEDILDYFVMGTELGRGHFGVVHRCTEKATGKEYACKCVAKNKLKTNDDIELIRREVMVMHTLLGVENCVQIKATFESQWYVFIVMELCTGGELFDRIAQTLVCRDPRKAEFVCSGMRPVAASCCTDPSPERKYRETSAARIFREIIRVIASCHAMGIIHRDVKPENFLLADSSPDAPIKAADFGLSVFFQDGQVFDEIVGTVDYIAPEILRRRYGPEVDVWAAGVILCILLSGEPPFWGETDQAIFNSIQRNKVRFDGPNWAEVSASAKDLILRCLDKDAKRRITAEEALRHEWVREEGGAAQDVDIRPAVLDRLRAFAGLQKLKKLGRRLLVRHLRREEIEGLRRIFVKTDKAGSGTITIDELLRALDRHGAHVAVSEVERLVERMDISTDGRLDYEAFLAATVHYSKAVTEDTLFFAFAEMDGDSDGFVTAEELATRLLEVAPGEVPLAELRQMIDEADANGDGKVDYLEFVSAMAPGLVKGAVSSASLSEYKERLAQSRSTGALTRATQRSRERLVPTREPSQLRGLLGRAGAGSWAAPESAPADAEVWADPPGRGRAARTTEESSSVGAPDSVGASAAAVATASASHCSPLPPPDHPGYEPWTDPDAALPESDDDDDDDTLGGRSPRTPAAAGWPAGQGLPRSHPSVLPRPEQGSTRRGSGWRGVVVRPSDTAGAAVEESCQSAERVIAEAGGKAAMSQRWRAGEWPQGPVFGAGDRDACAQRPQAGRRDSTDGAGSGSDGEDGDGARRRRIFVRRAGSSSASYD